MTNNAGLTYTVYVTAQDTNLVVGQPIPQFAYSISGPLIQDNLAVGIAFTVYSNLVTTAPPPPAPTLAGSITGAWGPTYPDVDGRSTTVILQRLVFHQCGGALDRQVGHGAYVWHHGGNVHRSVSNQRGKFL